MHCKSVHCKSVVHGGLMAYPARMRPGRSKASALFEAVSAAGRAARVRFAGERIPLAARIQVTRRCPLSCAYCKLPAEHGDLMDTGTIFRILSELAHAGCMRLSISGGEPLLREDVGRIVEACADLGMAPEMNTSGWGLEERIGEVGRLELLKLSLDGPEEIHDAVRGRAGSYRAAVRAARGRGRMR